jgi:hypothetical protein
MKDVTSTSFGLVIAFFLPGLAAFYSLCYWSSRVDQLFKTFLTTDSNVSLFLLVIAAAVTMGLQITLVRWLLFEILICRSQKFGPSFFKKLGTDENRLVAFKAVVDEHYRYHQFWGGMCIVIPGFVVGWLRESWNTLTFGQVTWTIIVFVLCEVLTGCAAYDAYKRYSTRAKEILGGGE